MRDYYIVRSHTGEKIGEADTEQEAASLAKTLYDGHQGCHVMYRGTYIGNEDGILGAWWEWVS